MRDVLEELRSIRNSEGKKPPTLEELSDIAEHCSEAIEDYELRRASFFKRMLPEYYSSFVYHGAPPIKGLMEETLFYIFYAMVDSDLQLQAYNELIGKGYLYSKTLDLFVLLAEQQRAVDSETHTVTTFDPWQWKRVARSVVFTREFIGGLEAHVHAV